MKYTVLIAESAGVRRVLKTERLFGGEGNLRLARKARWSLRQENRLTLFDYDECFGLPEADLR